MTQATPEWVQRTAHRAEDALNRDDLEGFLALVDPEVEFRSMIAEAEGELFRGHAGVRRWWEGIRGAFEQVEWDYLDVRAQDDRGVARLRIRGTLSGVEVEQMMWQAVRFRDGRLAWWRFFRSEREALEAAGMEGS